MDQDPVEVRREIDAARRRLALTLDELTARLNLPKRARLAARSGAARARARIAQVPVMAVVAAGGVAAVAATTLVVVRGHRR